jgi:hypothetical protein
MAEAARLSSPTGLRALIHVTFIGLLTTTKTLYCAAPNGAGVRQYPGVL